MPIVEGENNATAIASPTNSSPHLVLSPSSIPATSSPTTALPQYFPQNSQHSPNVMVEVKQKQQQTHNIAQKAASSLVPGLEASSYESQHQVPLQADGASSTCTSNASSVSNASASKEAVILGLQALERQQEEKERKKQEELERRRATMRSRRTTAVRRDNPFDASPQQDLSRYPQDAIYQGDVPSMVHLPNEEDSQKTLSDIHRETSARDSKGKKSIGKFLRNSLKIKKGMRNKSISKSDNGVKQDCDAQLSSDVNPGAKSIISGYLYKRGRQGKWQRRWFESDGKNLLYYKSNKRNRLLATLDLLNVGSVRMDNTDPAGCSFVIEVAGRNYYLCADSKDYAMDWVISMNRIREARMNIGNLRLITPLQNEIKLLDEEEEYAPRVVIVAPRKRAKGLGMEDFNENLDELNATNVTGLTEALSPVSGASASMISSNISSKQHGASGHEGQRVRRRNKISVRWRKRRPSYQNWIRRLSRWAKRLRSVRCVVKEDFQHLDNSAQCSHSKEKAQTPPLVETHDSQAHAKYEGDVAGPTNNTLESAVDPAQKYAHYTDPEVHVSGRGLDQISESEAALSEIPEAQANDEAYVATQKTKSTTNSWGQKQKRAVRKKQEDSSSREISINEDVDSSSGRGSPSSFDDEGSGVV